MAKSEKTYRLGFLLTLIAAWEILFWTLLFVLISVVQLFSNTSTKEELAFKEPSAFWLLLLLPIMVLLFLKLLAWKNTRFNQLGSPRIRLLITKPVSNWNTFWQFFWLRNAIVFLIVAMAQPVMGVKKVSATKETMELVIALDVSNSMNVRDLDKNTSRLEVAKRAIIQLLNTLHGERVGLCVFAGNAYVQLPLTADYEAAKMFVQEVETDMISNQGTHIGAALHVSNQMFSKLKSGKAIMILTDGEDHEGGIDEVMQELQKNRVEIAIMGLGTAEGGLIPNRPDRPEFGYKQDAKGSPVVSKMNPALIKEIASKSNGFSMYATNAYPNISEMLARLKKVKRAKMESMEFEVKKNRYQLPLALSLCCWLLYVLWISEVYTLWGKKL
jgi:Ca-activated chloride channel homolog